MEIAAQLAPVPIADDWGIRLAVSHVEFLGLKGRHIADWRARRAPLGMSAYQYREFCDELFLAAQADGLQNKNLDARLKGSAAAFYSGRHKSLPTAWSDFVKALADLLQRTPTPSELDELNQRVERFRGFQEQPRRCPFDSMFWLQLHTDRSDYDIQLSSKEIESRCIALRTAFPAIAPNLRHPKYGFLDDGLVSIAVPMILRWAAQWTVVFGRTVAVKAFGADGPENRTKTIGELSSHFRSDDWVLQPPNRGED